MKTCSTLEVVDVPAIKQTDLPVVFVDGVPEGDLWVKSYEARGLMDTRRVTVGSRSESLSRCLAGRSAAVAFPYALIDGESSWLPLVVGRFNENHEVIAAGKKASQWEIIDAWGDLITRESVPIWSLDSGGAIAINPSVSLIAGPKGNRSSTRSFINNQQVFLPSEERNEWSVGQALETISAIYQLDLSTALLSPAIRDAPLRQTLLIRGSVVDVLTTICDGADLVVGRELSRSVGQFKERRYLYPRQSGRPIHIRSVAGGRPLGRVIDVKTQSQSSGSRPWVARGGLPVVESTFLLSGAWDSAGEGQADEEYGRATSSDFSRFHNTYRLWELAVDPDSAGDPFDASVFFGQQGLSGNNLRFIDCLTVDDSESPLPPIVEISLDGGGTFQRHDGKSIIRRDKPAVYLDDATLDTSLLSSAKSGDLQVRITASLRSSRPIEIRRWQGNPFARALPERVLDVSEQYGWRRVDPASIHAEAVSVGDLLADVADDRQEMGDWLGQRLQQETGRLNAVSGEADLTLASTWPWLVPGDRLKGVLTDEGQPMPAMSYECGLVTSVVKLRCDFEPEPVTRVTVKY